MLAQLSQREVVMDRKPVVSINPEDVVQVIQVIAVKNPGKPMPKILISGTPRDPKLGFHMMSAAYAAMGNLYIEQAKKGELEDSKIVKPHGVFSDVALRGGRA